MSKVSIKLVRYSEPFAIAFLLTPKGNLMLAKKGQLVYDTSNNNDKDNITALFTVNVDCEYAPLLTIYIKLS